MGKDLEIITELLKKLIGFASYTCENSNKALMFAADYLKSHGLQPVIMENQGHRMLTCQTGEGEHCLILNGHLDVVAAEPEQYIPRVEGDRLYGRGSYDMLGACAVMLHEMCILKEKKPACRVILSLSTTEETDGRLCTGYMVENGLSGDFAICGEPTNLAVSIMSKGVLRLKMQVHGCSAHSSRPWQGENALLKAYRIYEEILKLPFVSHRNRFFDGASVNLSKVQGGVVMNQVPDHAEMVVDIRYLPGEDREEMVRRIKELDPDMELEVTAFLDAVEAKEDDPFLKRLTASVTAAIGDECRLIAQHGAADTAFFQEKGIPSVEFGPRGGGHHGPSEYVEISSLEEFLKCICHMVSAMEES
ncbi:MAG: M20 family metallopeptidase [Bariatricus sp.]